MSHELPSGRSDEESDRDTIVTVFGEQGDLRAAPPGTSASFTQLLLDAADEGEAAGRWSPNAVAHAPVRFKIRLASDKGVRSKASYLVDKMYAWRGYHTVSPMTPDSPEPADVPATSRDRVTLAAFDHLRALATITIGFDGAAGLMADELYRAEVDGLRSAGARLCEFTKLAIDRDQQSKELLAMMFHIAYMYAARIHGCTDLLIEVNPRHARFYQRMLGFRELGPERSCPRVGGAPALLLRLALAHARDQIDRYGGKKGTEDQTRSLYPFFFAPAEEAGIVGRLKAIG